jgi:hypothetical protein
MYRLIWRSVIGIPGISLPLRSQGEADHSNHQPAILIVVRRPCYPSSHSLRLGRQLGCRNVRIWDEATAAIMSSLPRGWRIADFLADRSGKLRPGGRRRFRSSCRLRRGGWHPARPSRGLFPANITGTKKPLLVARLLHGREWTKWHGVLRIDIKGDFSDRPVFMKKPRKTGLTR